MKNPVSADYAAEVIEKEYRRGRLEAFEEAARKVLDYPLPIIGGRLMEMMALREALAAAIRALKDKP